jgi:hypothetical protein
VKRRPSENDILQQFWSRVDKHGPLPNAATGVKSRCWLWLGSVTDEGYGRFKVGGKTCQVSRFAWKTKGKPDPGKLTVSTRCMNKLCVRHLYTRTRAEIVASLSYRQSGEDSHLARLTSRQVILMRKLYVKGDTTQAKLAKQFGISTGEVKNILARRSWKHL